MSWKPKYSKQSYKERNCGLHVISMITHIPIDTIEKYIDKNKGTTAFDVSFCLYQMGYEADNKLTKFYKGMQLPKLCIIQTQRHWSLYFDGFVYCSCLGIFPVENLRQRINQFLKVEVPNE